MTISEMLDAAQQRAKGNNLPYIGALLPSEAYALLQQAPGAKLVDVRTRAEWDYVGRVPGAVQIEWQHYPTGQLNPDFLTDLQAQVDGEALVMFICRSGARSHAAATAAAAAGYTQVFNVLEGFEGNKDQNGHRNTVGGWRVAGLPWVQN
ncbi:MAG: rhodanese-like domain-containing protein [Betaproteobacteria bacterium]|nr:MAG: rhodanese-like domain-containing protein [Betaproteobacteria bacterium]